MRRNVEQKKSVKKNYKKKLSRKKKEGNEAVGESESEDVLECNPRQESAYKISVSWYILRKKKYYVEKSHFSTLSKPFLCIYIYIYFFLQSSTKMAWRHFLSKKKERK